MGRKSNNKRTKPVREKVPFSKRLDQRFHISARNSTILQEIIGGTTVFLAMVYILPVGSDMYALVGRNAMTSVIAIALVTALISALMGGVANVAICLSTGMGLNAMAVFTVCLTMGYPYELVMLCTLIEGVAFLILSLTGLRAAFAKSIPQNLKLLIGAGIGGFLIYIGSQNAHLIVGDPSTLTTMVNFRTEFHTQGITALLAFIGIALMIILLVRDNKAAVFIGMLAVWGLGCFLELIGVYIPDPATGYYSLFPSLALPSMDSFRGMTILSSLGNVVGSYGASDYVNIIVVTCTMFYSDFMDTMGTAMTCLTNLINKLKEELAEIHDEHQAILLQAEIDGLENPKTLQLIMIMDAIGTIVGSFFMDTTVTCFAESNAGEGRTGLSAIVTSLWFTLCIVFASVFTTVPSYATGAALIVVGGQMIYSGFKYVDYDVKKLCQTLPGVLCFTYVILTYNIANGMAWGIVLYTLTCLFSKNKEDRKNLGLLIPIMAALLVVKFALL